MLKVDNLSKVFIQKKINGFKYTKYKIPALSDISFSMNKGEVLGILGPNGAGKTTLIRMLFGAIIPSGGKISINNEESFALEELRGLFGVAGVSQRSFFNKLTARENIQFFAKCIGLDAKSIDIRINELEDFFKLGKNLDTYYQFLSSGNRKRVSLMRAFIHDPAILLLDEITDNLDPIFREDLLLFLKTCVLGTNKIMIFASQRTDELQQLCSKVIILNKGFIIKEIKIPEEQNHFDLLQEYKNALEGN